MKQHCKYLIVLVLFFSVTFSFSQNAEKKKMEDEVFTIRGTIRDKYSYAPVSFVNVEVNGGAYTVSSSEGTFKIKVKLGDELIIKHKDFETVYYTVEDDERVFIEVEPGNPEPTRKERIKRSTEAFNKLIDSAKLYRKKDASKSIQFIADAFDQSVSQNQNAEAYEVLGDVYMFWKQYDLAVMNYRISLQNIVNNSVLLKLAEAYRKNKNYQESIQTYSSIAKKDLTNWEAIELNEGLGNTYLDIKDYDKAISFYQDGLKIANRHLISPKITDLNSKIAQSYNQKGEIKKAEGFFSNSLNLAEQENMTRALEEKNKVADFENTNRSYDDEIELRKSIVKDTDIIERDSIIANESPLTPQKQNYKIGNAYYLQRDYDSAIPYLQKSIKEADNREDLVVKKDALKKLTDVHENSGDYESALSAFKEYTDVVDELYIKKEQEISQAGRFRNSLAEKQNRITSLENDRALSKTRYDLSVEKTKRQQLIIYSLIGGVVLLLTAGYFMFNYIKQQRLANNLLALKSLRSQMNPHFIFNALNSVNSFIAINDERTANKYLSDFSFLMRAVLENSEEDFIPLQKEIELLELYTKLEHFRFKDKFDYVIDVDESINVEEFQIPPMLLQPYIENAVWHGLRYKKEKGRLSITIKSKGKGELIITIADDGIGRKRSKALKTSHQKKQKSKGMANIKERVAILNKMYKDKVDVAIEDLQPSEDAGTKVIVTLKKD